MTEGRRRMVRGTALFVGSIVGAGIFGLPFAFAQVGVGMGLLLLVVVGAFLWVLQLLTAEITIQTPGHKRLAGLAAEYLGPVGRWVTTFLFFGGAWGATLAYLILGSDFLAALFGPVVDIPSVGYVVIFVLIIAVLLRIPVNKVAGVETVVGGILLMLFVVLLLAGLPHLQLAQLPPVIWEPKSILLTYGVILMALGGMGLAPEMHAIFGERYELRMPRAVTYGLLIVVALYGAFGLVVVGVNGGDTAQNALLSYVPVLGPGMLIIGSLVGFLAISSIFLMVGQQLKDTLHYDFRAPYWLAWILTWGVPLGLYLLGIQDFISIIGFIGSVFSALLATVLLLIYERMRSGVCRKVRCFTVPRGLTVIIGLVFVSGALIQIYQTFFL